MPLQDDYQVTLEAFQGPLDLLLYLIRRAEVDVNEIPIARITDQYLEFLEEIEEIDIDLAGDFLVMASTLIEIKSRALMPPAARPPAEGAPAEGSASLGPDPFIASITSPAGLGEGDPGHELIRQLLAYQRYRVAAEELDDRREAFALRYPSVPGRRDRADQPAETVELDLEDAHLLDLVDAYEHIMASIDFSHVGDHVVEIDDTPIALHQEDLLDRLMRSPDRRLKLLEVFQGHNRGERVGLFLAMLELVRLRNITVRQRHLTADIVLKLKEEGTEALRG